MNKPGRTEVGIHVPLLAAVILLFGPPSSLGYPQTRHSRRRGGFRSTDGVGSPVTSFRSTTTLETRRDTALFRVRVRRDDDPASAIGNAAGVARRRYGRSLVSSRSTVWGNSFDVDDYDYDDDAYYNDDDDGRGTVDLSYLRVDESDLPPKTRDVLRRATLYYMCDGVEAESCDVDLAEPPPRIDEVLDVIDEEYHFSRKRAPLVVGNVTFDEDGDGAEDASKVLSFAAMHGLPKEITSYLLPRLDAVAEENRTDDEAESGGGDEGTTLQRCALQFERGGGWDAVSFPRGLALRPKRQFSRDGSDDLSRYSPPRRRRLRLLPTALGGRSSNAVDAEAADLARLATEGAATARPPERRVSRAELLAELDAAMGALRRSEEVPVSSPEAPEWAVGELMKFFPPKEERARILKKAARAATRATRRIREVGGTLNDRLAGLGKGGFLAYGFLNFAWYTLAIAVQWRRFGGSSSIPRGTAGAVAASVRKFGRVFLSAYVGSQVTKLPRVWAALALAPLGNRTLRSVERRLKVTEATAFGMVTGLLFGSCFAIWAALIFGDALVASAGTFSM